MRYGYPLSGPLLLLAVIVSVTGCGQDDITRYQISRIDPPENKVRLLAAMVPTETATWFIKYTGPLEPVAAHESAFHKLVESISFTGDKIEYKLPEGWTEVLGGADVRHSTIMLPEKIGTATVTKFGKDAGSVLANVNRWRKEVAAEELMATELPESTETIPLGKWAAVYVDVKGPGKKINPMQPPMPMARQQAQPKVVGDPAAPKDLPFAYELPEGWKLDGKATQFSIMNVTTGGARMTVSSVGGSLPENISRWFGQAKLPATADDVKAGMKARNLGGRDGHTVELIGKEFAILGAAVPLDGQHLYFKLSGEPKAVETQKPAFERFLQSLRFGAGKGATDGK